MTNSADEHTRFLFLLGRLERLNQELVAHVCGRHDISASEIRVLAMLREVGPTGVRPATLGEWVVQTAGGLTATLKRLERDGRIVTSADPEDGRSKRIALSAAGQAFYDEVVAELSDRYRLMLNDVDLGPASRQVEQLIDALERSAGHPSSAAWRDPLPSASTDGSPASDSPSSDAAASENRTPNPATPYRTTT